MGRQERCEGACSEHKLELVNAFQYDDLLRAAAAAAVRGERLRPVMQAFADTEEVAAGLEDVLADLGEKA